MVALTEAKGIFHQGPTADFCYPMAASAVAYAGGFAMVDSGGNVKPATAEASNRGVKGYFIENYDNGSGAAGDKTATVRRARVNAACSGADQTWVGQTAYASDDQTVSNTQGANEPEVGEIVEFISATEVVVYIK